MSVTRMRAAGDLNTASKIKFYLCGDRLNDTLCGCIGISGRHVKRNLQHWAKGGVLNVPLCSSKSCFFVSAPAYNVSGNLMTTELGRSWAI